MKIDVVQIKQKKEELEKQASQLATSPTAKKSEKVEIFADLTYYTKLLNLAENIEKSQKQLEETKQMLNKSKINYNAQEYGKKRTVYI